MKEKTSKILKFTAVICLILNFAIVVSAQQKQIDIKLLAKQFIDLNESKLRETKVPRTQLNLLRYLAPAALSAGETEKAADFAERLLTVGKSLENEPGFGPSFKSDSIHIANIVLGRIALANGDIEKAKEFLLVAGQVKGSPTLNSFGPDMLLAKQLIEKNERDTAIKYFALCADFWKMEDGKLEQWKNVVKQGGTPDFKGNLGYITDTWRFA